MSRAHQRLKIDVSFEDAVRKILKAGPMPTKKPMKNIYRVEGPVGGNFSIERRAGRSWETIAEGLSHAEMLERLRALTTSRQTQDRLDALDPRKPTKRTAPPVRRPR